MPIDHAFYKPTLIKRVQDSAIEYALNKMDHIILWHPLAHIHRQQHRRSWIDIYISCCHIATIPLC